ncbi:hypothetical protein QE422_001935 [Chryseobacterium sp. SORGH_AS 447]|nr:hypothetical protein [Chryseobacterium sp. SORGH_AS_0447]
MGYKPIRTFLFRGFYLDNFQYDTVPGGKIANFNTSKIIESNQILQCGFKFGISKFKTVFQ